VQRRRAAQHLFAAAFVRAAADGFHRNKLRVRWTWVFPKEPPLFDAISIPFGTKMLFNTIKLKPGVSMDDVEMALGEMCNVVKETYGGDRGGFLAGQVFKFSGFVSDKGSLNALLSADDHIAIVTYWRSFEEHEKSHADEIFNAKFSAIAAMCTDSKELGYDMLWQGSAGR
jgi:hypothetical protein